MFCTNCGGKIPERGNFCVSCGSRAPAPPVVPAARPAPPPAQAAVPFLPVPAGPSLGSAGQVIATPVTSPASAPFLARRVRTLSSAAKARVSRTSASAQSFWSERSTTSGVSGSSVRCASAWPWTPPGDSSSSATATTRSLANRNGESIHIPRRTPAATIGLSRLRPDIQNRGWRDRSRCDRDRRPIYLRHADCRRVLTYSQMTPLDRNTLLPKGSEDIADRTANFRDRRNCRTSAHRRRLRGVASSICRTATAKILERWIEADHLVEQVL